jgi:glycosyltransferase involved in cell wall biosynthesis
MVHPMSVAMADRNGTAVVRRATHLLSDPVDLVGPPGRMVDDYWQRDPGYALSLIPRRYGGLCLPALEAMSAGTPVVMPDCSPNQDWPTIPVAAVSSGKLRMKGGSVPIHDVTPQNLARTVKPWLADPERLEAKRSEVRQWAEANSWEVLESIWQEALEDAAT